MKITSYANSDFKIDGISILPGTKNYKKIDPTKPEVKYQLGILKQDGILDFNELIVVDPDVLPFVKDEPVKVKAKKKTTPVKKSKKSK